METRKQKKSSTPKIGSLFDSAISNCQCFNFQESDFIDNCTICYKLLKWRASNLVLESWFRDRWVTMKAVLPDDTDDGEITQLLSEILGKFYGLFEKKARKYFSNCVIAQFFLKMK